MSDIVSVNPSNSQTLGTITATSEKEVISAVAAARKAQPEWRSIGLASRIEILRRVIQEFKSRGNEFALLQSREMGMPIVEALQDIDGSVDYANWYFDNAELYLSPEVTHQDDNEIHTVYHEPVGVVAVIVPWNFPFANFIWGAMQSLIAGNTVVFKHSEEVPLCGKFIEEIVNKYLPSGVFNEVYGDGTIGAVLADQDIDMIAFTGSTRTGRYLYEVAGKKFIKAVMELGGSAPGIIFEDADIDTAVGDVCNLRLLNAGQCCDGLKRLLVHESIVNQVQQRIAAQFASKRVGNAEDDQYDVGPLVAKRQLDLLVGQVEDAVQKGASVICGGTSLEAQLGGAFYEPTILTNVTDDMRVWNEEVFGPVLPIVTFKTEEEAIQKANATSYGLGAYVFTSQPDRADRLAEALESGMISVNGTNYVMPFNPFGGYKQSGVGREHGKYGFNEVTQIKVVAKKV